MSASLKLTKLNFFAGERPENNLEGLEIRPGTAVIFVGPNNSGKSLALREIENWCFGKDEKRFLIKELSVDLPTDAEEMKSMLKFFETPPPKNQGLKDDIMWIGQHTFRADQPVRSFQIQISNISQLLTSPSGSAVIREWLIGSYTIRLDGRTRFSLADPKPTGDLQLSPQNHLWALFRDDEAREQVRLLAEEAFGLHFVIDPTGMNFFRIRMSARKPADNQEEQGLDDKSRKFHSESKLINDLSDGVQAFVGLVSAVLSLPHKILLIDEPEAFLHPPLAKRLGKSLARITYNRNASLVVSTHSSEFLLGCLEVIKNTSVVRLTYENGIATARSLSPDDLEEMSSNPLLRSTGVLKSLFHKGVIVTEADTDRAFYEEINTRLLAEDMGAKDTLFLNAVGKDTIHQLIKPLRKVGIPAVAIIDLDYLELSGDNWTNLIKACQIPTDLRSSLEKERVYLAGVYRGLPVSKGSKRPIKKGLAMLNDSDRLRAEKLLKKLSEYGLFIVSEGEVEGWLGNLGVSGHGPRWLREMFQKIGQSESEPGYLRPTDDDVWNFINKISNWIKDPNRLGT
ncbi:MAG: AAA family ATPase [Patescibacteria group bacterium]